MMVSMALSVVGRRWSVVGRINATARNAGTKQIVPAYIEVTGLIGLAVEAIVNAIELPAPPPPADFG